MYTFLSYLGWLSFVNRVFHWLCNTLIRCTPIIATIHHDFLYVNIYTYIYNLICIGERATDPHKHIVTWSRPHINVNGNPYWEDITADTTRHVSVVARMARQPTFFGMECNNNKQNVKIVFSVNQWTFLYYRPLKNYSNQVLISTLSFGVKMNGLEVVFEWLLNFLVLSST